MLKEIKTAIENDNLILFVGAGMSMSLGFPNWNSLIEKILVQLEEEHTENSLMNFQNYIKVLKNGSKSVFEILESIENNGYKKETKEILHKIISEVNFEGAELKNQRKLWEISDKIITTNYDNVLEEVKPKGIEVFANDNTFQQVKSIKGNPFLYKIHGNITNPDTCILFKSDYEDLYKGDKSNKQTLQSFLQNKTLLFVGFSLEDPFITDQISYLYDLYNGYGNKHAIVLTSDKDFEKYHVKTHKVENWKEGFDSFLDELIAIKKAAKSVLPITLTKETTTDVDINAIEDILYLESILEDKSKDLSRQQGEELRKTTKEFLKIRDRLLELQAQKYDLGSQQKIPDLQQHELEHLFDTIFNSPKLSTVTKNAINDVKNQNNSQYKDYHRSVIVSALACSLINHKEDKLDATKIDFLIDFANDAEDKVWQKAITYLVLVLNHLGNQWLRFPSIQTKLKRLKDHKEIQEALKDILKIMQFEFKSSSFVGEKVFENDYFKDYPFNYFMPFYENNPSIGNLYNRGDIEVEELVKFLYAVPLPDSFKYLVCNSKDFILKKIDHSSESDIKYLQSLSILSAYDPYLNYINEIFSFYKNTQNKIVLNEKISIISVKNINEHLLNAIEQYRAMARQFIVEKNWGTAITYLNALLKLSPDDIEALLALIQCYDINDKSIDDRLKLRRQIENILPKMDENLFQIGNLLVDEEKYKDAINYYNKAIEINQKEAYYYFNRGSAKKYLKKYEEAILDYDRAIKMDASDANYHYNRGGAKYWLKYYNEAIIDLDKAIEIEPKNAVFYTFRGLAKRDSNDFNGAIIDFDKGIELNPKNETAYSAKSNLFRLLLKFNDAHDLINIAIRLDSNASNYYGTKAAIYSSQNNEEGFYKYAEIAFEKKAKASWFDDDVKEKYRNEPRFQALLAKYNLSLDEEE